MPQCVVVSADIRHLFKLHRETIILFKAPEKVMEMSVISDLRLK